MSGRVGSITTDIIADGLVFNIDAANRASYPRTGTTATDTIGNTSGTLSGAGGSNNTPQWESTNGGVFNFDGTDDEIDFPSSTLGAGLSNFSILAWAKLIGTDTGYESIVSVDGPAGRVWNLFEWSTNRGWGFQLINNSGNSVYTPISAVSTSSNIWYNVVGTYDGNNARLYVDGVLKATVTQTGPLRVSTTENLKIGNNGYNEYLSGDIGPVQIYNRALSANEVLHNYNALKGRFS